MGKTLLISGAAGGLGSMIAKAEAGRFGRIILVDNSGKALEKAAKSIHKAEVHALEADVADLPALKRALSQFKGIDALVNAAGVLGPVERFGEEDFGEWKRAIEVNLIGTAAMCKAALPQLLSSRRGKIINFAGGGAAGVRPHHSSYASSKAAVVRFTEILAAEYPGIDANAIAPGAHNTGIWKTEKYDAPPEKWADPARFLALASFLLSEKSDGISGKFIHIYDSWENFPGKALKKDMFTLRRVEPKRL